MMQYKSLLFVLLLVSFTHAISSQSNKIQVHYDYVKSSSMATTTVGLFAKEHAFGSAGKIWAGLQFLKFPGENGPVYKLNAVFKSNLLNWPLSREVFLIINNETYPINLVSTSANRYHIQDENTMTNADGTTMVSTSHEEFHLYKFEADIPSRIFERLDREDKAMFVFYSGEIPLHDLLSPNDLARMVELAEWDVFSSGMQ